MQQPLHTLGTQISGSAAELTPRRAGSTVLVIAIEVAIIALLIYGMAPASVEKKLQDITTTVEDKVEVKAPPPPPPDTAKPPPPFIPPPDFQIATEAPVNTSIASQSVKSVPPLPPTPTSSSPAERPPTPAELIPSTKTTPPYPAISQRLGEEGTVQLMVTVGTDGIPTSVVVDTSSSKPRLDQQAIDWVKGHYRWKPCTKDGKPIPCVYPLNVKFDLKDVQ
jgi:protein TonB